MGCWNGLKSCVNLLRHVHSLVTGVVWSPCRPLDNWPEHSGSCIHGERGWRRLALQLDRKRIPLTLRQISHWSPEAWPGVGGDGVLLSGSGIEPTPAVLEVWSLNHWLLFFSRSVGSDSLRPHRLQHSRLPCPSPSPRVCPGSCPLNWWCHPAMSFSIFPFSSCLQSFPASGSFQMSQPFISGGQSIGATASASVLPKSIQGWFPLTLTGWISLKPGDS